MTKNDLIFLGACTLFAPVVDNFGALREGAAKYGVEGAIKLAEQIYDKTNSKPQEPTKYRLEVYYTKPDGEGYWAPTSNDGIRGIVFHSKEAAEAALVKHGSPDMEYRVVPA